MSDLYTQVVNLLCRAYNVYPNELYAVIMREYAQGTEAAEAYIQAAELIEHIYTVLTRIAAEPEGSETGALIGLLTEIERWKKGQEAGRAGLPDGEMARQDG